MIIALSTATVHEFPDLASRSWRWMKEAFDEHYQKLGWPSDAVTQMLATLGPIYAAGRDGPAVTDLQAEPSPEEVVQAVNRWVSEMVIRLMTEIADRELVMIANGLAETPATIRC
jgi:hypothetical protein